MANDKDSEKSKARVGLKREVASTMEAQSHISGSHNRARPNENRNAVHVSANKRPRNSGSLHDDIASVSVKKNEEEEHRVLSEEETKSENEEPRSLSENEEPRTGFVLESSKSASTSKKPPSWKLKDLIASRVLEGMTVNYVPNMKAQKLGATGLKGVIRASGIECSCEICNRDKIVVGATTFEQHAGSSNKRPAENIKLENGSTLRDIMNTFSYTPLAELEETVRNLLSSLTMPKSTFCIKCKGTFEDGNDLSKLLCNSCTALKDCQRSPTQTTEDSNTCASPAVLPRSLEPDVLPKSINSGVKQSTSHGKNQPKLAKKDLRMHKSVFGKGVLEEGAELSYRVRGQTRLVGHKEGNGIRCSCCDSVVSPSQFEAHAGCASRRKPYMQICTADGVSLHKLSIESICNICAVDGGNLLSCDSCTRVFHIDCVPLPCKPSGNWHCRYCQNVFQKEKHERRTRVVKTNEGDHGGCALCGGDDFIPEVFCPQTVIICDQCEKEYHVGCLKDHNMQSLEEKPEGNWFCCSHCDQIHTNLEKLVARGEQNLPDSLLSLIKKNYVGKGIGLDIKWRLLNWKMDDSDEISLLLPKAVAILHEQFDPIIDPTTDLDFIVEMLYGRSIVDNDFRGMYCAVLIVNQVVVCTGVFRVFGTDVAELPLVATKSGFQGQGHFRCLFSCIERVLGHLKVKNFVLPAAKEAESMWTNKFGFTRLDKNEINEYKRYFNLVAFEGTSFLQKPVPAL